MTELSINLASKIDPIGKKRGEKFGNAISTSQIRQIYSRIKQAEDRYRADNDVGAAVRRLKLIKPHLAYMAARDSETEEFKTWLTDQINKVADESTSKRLEYFFRQLEAIVAYHNRADGGSSLSFEAGQKAIQETNSTAKKHAKRYYEDEVTTTQLRHIFGEVKQAQAQFRQPSDDKSDGNNIAEAQATLHLLLPHLTYMAARHDETERLVTDVRGWIKYAVEGETAELEEFFELMEAIVAYHKYYSETEETHR